MIFFQHIMHRMCRTASKRISAISMTVHKCFALIVVGIECLIDFFCRNGNCHRHISTCQPFGNTHDIRTDSGMVTSKHLSCSSKSRCYFIGNQQNTIFITQYSEFFQILSRIHSHSGTSLQQRFYNHRTGFFSIFLKFLFRLFKTLYMTMISALSVRTTITVRCIDSNRIHQHRLIDFCIQIQGSNRKCSNCFTMISVRQTHKLCSVMSLLIMILKCHFQRTFHCSRTVV